MENTSTHTNNNAKKPNYRSVFISDIHLGTKDCKADALNDFLKSHHFDALYLVGDIFDGWQMKSGVYWHKSFNRVISRVLRISKNNVPVYYITGNHDEFLRKYANASFDNIQVVNRIDHITADGKKLLVIHGDQFEHVIHTSRFIKHIGDKGYTLLMFINRLINTVRKFAGFDFWSFSSFLKNNIERAQKHITDYEQAVSYHAKKKQYDGVVCGHIHQAAHKKINDTIYCNTGDWVESCSAIVEHTNGQLELIHWLKHPAHQALTKKKQQKLNAKKKFKPHI